MYAGRMRKRMKIDVQKLADSMRLGLVGTYHLDAESGGIEWLPNDTDEIERDPDARALAEKIAANKKNYLEIPHEERGEVLRRMESFAEAVEEPRLAKRLKAALKGRNAAARFLESLEPEREAAVHWKAAEEEAGIESAREWLRASGIDPIWERPTKKAVKETSRTKKKAASVAEIRLEHVLMLGGPAEPVEGRVVRVHTSLTEDAARTVYERLVRDACTWRYVDFRASMAEGVSFEIDTIRIVRAGKRIEVSVSVPRAVRDAFEQI